MTDRNSIDDVESLAELFRSGKLTEVQFEEAKDQVLGVRRRTIASERESDRSAQSADSPQAVESDESPAGWPNLEESESRSVAGLPVKAVAISVTCIVASFIAVFAIVGAFDGEPSQPALRDTPSPTLADVARQCDFAPVQAWVNEWNEVTGRVAGAYNDLSLSSEQYLTVHEQAYPSMTRLVDQLAALDCDDNWWLDLVQVYKDRLLVWVALANSVRVGSAEAEDEALRMADVVNRRADELICSMDPSMGELLEQQLGLQRC